MAVQTPNDVRVKVLDEPVLPSQEIRCSAPVDEENQNGIRMAGDLDATAPLLGGESAAENLAEMEIRSLLWIKRPGNEMFREALEIWQAKDKLFASRVDKKRIQSNSLWNEIFQLIGYYLFFQGVLMTAVAQAHFLTCHNWWTAFFLSLLASVVTVGGVIQKFVSVIALEKTIASEGFTRMLCINRVNKLLQQKERISFQKDAKDPDENRKPPAQTRLWWSGVVVSVILLIFSSLFLASVRVILCDSGLSGSSPAPSTG